MHQELCLYLSIVCCSRAPATAAVFSCCSWCCWSCPVQLFLLAKSCGVRLFQWFHRYYYRCLILDTFAPCIHICICTRNQAHTHLHWCERLLFVGFFSVLLFDICSSTSMVLFRSCFMWIHRCVFHIHLFHVFILALIFFSSIFVRTSCYIRPETKNENCGSMRKLVPVCDCCVHSQLLSCFFRIASNSEL